MAVINLISSFLGIASFLILWLAIYFFREIVLDAEKLERKGLGSGLILLALPLLLVQPIASSYFYITTGRTVPADMALVTTGAFLLSTPLLIAPILNLTRLSRSTRIPWAFLALFLAPYLIVGLAYFHNFPPIYLAAQAFYLLAEMLLGIGFILLSRYTADFKELTVEIAGKRFSTHFDLSSFLMVTGMALPINAVLRGVAIDAFLAGGAGIATAQEMRFLAHAVLTAVALGGAIGMLVFKKTVEEFCVRTGSMNALLKKDEPAPIALKKSGK